MSSLTKILTTAGLVLVAIIILSIGSCVQYERTLQTACIKAGGVFGYANGVTGCYKTHVQYPDALPLPELVR